ncbi:hypothetical protein SEA_ATUIN_250 [Arthrobacter phage Atuin]|nr:hypothetical protein SEA_ATUIN_49 [Arthrobacter phage Atuin]
MTKEVIDKLKELMEEMKSTAAGGSDISCRDELDYVADQIDLLIDKLEKDQPEYEYALLKTRLTDNLPYLENLVWEDDKEAVENDALMMQRGSGYFIYTVLKRRKAGEIEFPEN